MAERAARRRPLRFDQLALGISCVVAAVVALLSPADGDTWWALRAGDQIRATRSVPTVETWSVTAAGNPWPDHSWLWQVLASWLHDVGGMPLFTLAHAAVAVAGLLLAVWTVPATPLRRAVVILACLPVLASVWAVRPQATSMLLFVVLARWLLRDRWWPVPLLFLVWANVHAGVAVGGLTLVVALAVAGVRAWRWRGADDVRRVRGLLLVTAVSALATLCTPMGVGLWRYVVDTSARARDLGIVEWQPALVPTAVSVAFWCWVLALLAAAVLARRAARASSSWASSWAGLLLVVLAGVLAVATVASVRLVGFFVLAAGPALLAVTRRVAVRRAPADDAARRVHDVVLAAVAVGGAALVAAAWAAPLPSLGWRPVDDATAAAVRACRGVVFNDYASGGALLWFVPDVPVFADSRFDPYPTSLLKRVRAAEGGQGYRSLFAEYDVRCAVVPAGPLAQALGADGWQVVHRDGDRVVLVFPSLVSPSSG